MVYITGDQEIPSALLDKYRATLTEKQPDGVSRKRYPYRVPHMQKTGADNTAKQRKQRARFLQVRDKFNILPQADRARWYAARPPWSSYLWYYNYFIMSGLMDVLGANPEGASVIASIKHYPYTLLAGAPADVTVAISTIDPTKAAAFPYGAAHYMTSAEDPVVWWAWAVYPYVKEIMTEHVLMRASETISANAGASVSVIEYI